MKQLREGDYMKKILFALLILSILLVGCAPSRPVTKQTTQTTPTVDQPAAGETPTAADQTTITSEVSEAENLDTQLDENEADSELDQVGSVFEDW